MSIFFIHCCGNRLNDFIPPPYALSLPAIRNWDPPEGWKSEGQIPNARSAILILPSDP